jgi:hypothetical protein
MSWHMKVVNDDPVVFKEAFRWYREVPGFLRHLQDIRGRHDDEEEFAESMRSGLNYLASLNGVPKALVHGEIHDDGTVEGHLMCAPDANLDLVAATITFAKMKTLEGYPIIVSHVLRRHKTLVEAIQRAGFKDSGMRAFQGVYRGRPQEILYFVAER